MVDAHFTFPGFLLKFQDLFANFRIDFRLQTKIGTFMYLFFSIVYVFFSNICILVVIVVLIISIGCRLASLSSCLSTEVVVCGVCVCVVCACAGEIVCNATACHRLLSRP
eukprot:m.203236 g.203236  ORF g.203236 m.203236 type:complete len:110 (+) comp32849_c3_seq1:1052-1381(+)